MPAQAAAAATEPAAPAAPLQNLFADVAALLCQPGEGPMTAGPAATRATTAAAAAGDGTAAPPAEWFAGQPSGWSGAGFTSAAAAAGHSSLHGQGELKQSTGQRALRGRGGGRRQTYADHSGSEEEEEASSSEQGGGMGRRGRQRRGSTPAASRQQRGRRTSGRARQQHSYRESGSEEEGEAAGICGTVARLLSRCAHPPAPCPCYSAGIKSLDSL